jgi:hypothetical protein
VGGLCDDASDGRPGGVAGDRGKEAVRRAVRLVRAGRWGYDRTEHPAWSWGLAPVEHGHGQIGDLVSERRLVQVRLEQPEHKDRTDEYGLQVCRRPRVG